MKVTSLTKLTVSNAQYYGYHGVKEEERQLGGKYEVDLELSYDSRTAIVNDDVKYAINYEEAMFCISKVISEESYNLVETIANEILNQCMERFPMLSVVTVRVRKYYVPIRRVIDFIEAEQTMERKV